MAKLSAPLFFVATKILVISGNIIYRIEMAWGRYAVRVGREQGEVQQGQARDRFRGGAAFDFDTALYTIDDTMNYGEERILAIGVVGARLHALVFTERGDVVRVISLRQATRSENRRFYER
ncbi:BrnT family toxin [Aquamicrobium soli]|uniref:BrnT family toxin n=1 Tax=Aquamicrobium soli TaxID=1811518 RepID=A0ABV7KCR0_9HYPH